MVNQSPYIQQHPICQVPEAYRDIIWGLIYVGF